MKYIIIISLLSAASMRAQAQVVVLSALYESTIAGGQYGGAAGYQGKKGFMAGVFYQLGETRSEGWPPVKTEFYGIESYIPLARCEKVTFSAHLRAGMANTLFFVFVPGAQTIIHVNKHVSLGSGLSWRYGHAAIDGHIYFKL